jgi:hypothetical protein
MNEKNVEDLVLKNIRLFFFLQEFDYYRRSGDESSQKVMARFSKEENLEDPINNLSFMHLDTSLGILLPVFAYSARMKSSMWDEVGFSIAPHYQCVTKNKHGQVIALSTDLFLRIMRNSLAHYADFLNGQDAQTVFFEPAVIRFKSRDGEIHFPEVDGYIHFLSDFLRANKSIIRKGLSKYLE